MIEVSHLSKSFPSPKGPVTVLDDVSFSVTGGEIFAVIGPSGAGKSTLAHCLNLLTRPTSGEVIVNGENLAALDASALRVARRRIGTVFQSSSLLSRRTAAENVALPLQYLGATTRSTTARVAELLDRVGMAAHADHYPHQLSGGQRQRVGIARALALKPAVLLSDEATSGLDPEATESFLQLLAEVRDELALAVVFITHEMDVITRIADRVGRLEHGHIRESGAVTDLVLDPESALGAALRRPGLATGAPDGHATVTLTYHSANVDPAWLSVASAAIGTPIAVLGATVHSVNGVTAGQWTVSIDDHSVHALVTEAGRHGITATILTRASVVAV